MTRSRGIRRTRCDKRPPHTVASLLARTEPDGDCALWTGAKVSGYGSVWSDGVKWLAHRLVLSLSVGPAPGGKPFACHAPMPGGHPRACIAPDHLRWGSSAENAADRMSDGIAIGAGRHLTDAEVRDAREQLIAGVSAAQVARNLKTTRKVIGCVKRGETYRNVA